MVLNLKSAMKGKHNCEFLSGFARHVQAVNSTVEEADSNSDSDLPLNNVAVDFSENTDSALDLALNEIQISPTERSMEKG